MANPAEVSSPSGPKQRKPGKRSGRRVARACDACRLRKAKCDGLNPCEACQTTERYCTYDLSAGQSTGSGTRIRILEDRLRRARAYLHEAQRRTPSLAHVDFDALLGSTEEYAGTDSRSGEVPDTDDKNDQDRLDSMMDSYGQMTLNTNGSMERDFYGAASGLAWIQKTRDYFEDSASGTSSRTDDTEANDSAAVQLFDAPLPLKHTLHVDIEPAQLMPPREVTTKLLHVVFSQVYPMFHFLDEDDFHTCTDRIYQLDPSMYSDHDNQFLTLFYLVVGLGYLFSREQHDKLGCRSSIAEGMRHFVVARTRIDIAHLRTITSLQSLVSLILFLVSTARMGSAHAFVGSACAAAMRQGLHFRSTHDSEIPLREKRVRRRVFWAIMNLDMYISGVLGLPPFMEISAVDPAIDLTIAAAMKEARDEHGLRSPSDVALASSAKYIELMRIMFKARNALYPKPTDPPDATQLDGTISVSVKRLQEAENQFRQWAESLTDILTYPDDSTETQSVKYEMHICYYFAQIVLYRPFMHYLVKQNKGHSISRRQLSYAHTCVQMATKVIEVSIEHQRRGLLCPASWPSIYTVFISIVCLVFALATQSEPAPASEMEEDIENGIRLLACTACTTDTGSVRCLEILRRLIKRVSYAVHIDLDKICADTTPCCTTDFTPKKPRGQDPNATVLQPVHTDRSTSESGTTASRESSANMVTGGSQAWTLSPDMSMTQPSFASVGQVLQPREAESQGYFPAEPDEMMQVPYGGGFGWQQNDFEPTAPSAASLYHPQGLPSQLSGSNIAPTSTPRRRVTARDIAAYMHSSGIDDPYRGNPSWDG